MKNKILNLIVVILSSCIFLFFFIYSNGLHSLMRILKELNARWLLMALFYMILYWFFETMIFYILIPTISSTQNRFTSSLRYCMIGQYFGALTPLASGSQPSQLYAMTEDGLPGGDSSSLLMVKFIIHQSVNTIYLTLVLLFSFRYFNRKIKNFNYFCVLGYSINISIIIMAILICISPKITKIILNFILLILNKLKIVKDVKSKYNNLEHQLNSFHEKAVLIPKHLAACAYATIFTFLEWAAFYSIPYCIYRSFGFSSAHYIRMLSAQVLLAMFMSFIPLPGAEGGAEGGFYLIYRLFFKADTILPAIFIWRILTYYLNILVGSISTLILRSRKA
jgi:glycosyltransferase 2 family protein